MAPPPTLQTLPAELILQIWSHLDVPDLLQLTRTAHRLRTLSFDPLLHAYRLKCASAMIENYISLRPPLTDLLARRIYITRTTLAARTLGRDFIRIKLNRMLGRRPSAESLVGRGVLPKECLAGNGQLAPSLIEVKRRVERERVKDGLRHWVEEWRRRGCEKGESMREGRPDVRRMAKWFAKTKESREVSRWGTPGIEKERREAPTRANVLGLRRFWERVAREGVVVPNSPF